jgi:hypothetical protein
MFDATCLTDCAPNRFRVVASLAVAAALMIGTVTDSRAGDLYMGVNSAMVSSDVDLSSLPPPFTSNNTAGLVQDDSRVALRFLGGYYFNGWLAVEGGYNDVDSIFAAVGTSNYHFDISGIDLSAVFRLPLGTILGQKIGFYAKAGAINWKSELSLNSPGTIAKTEESGTDLVYGGGVEAILFEHILVRGDLTIMDIDPAEAGAGDLTLGGLTMGLIF